jgi:hypothetical protein
VHIVEHHGVAQLVVRLPVECLVACRTSRVQPHMPCSAT